MNQTTDLEQLKDIAKMLLMTEVHKTEYSPLAVQHPFTSSGIVGIRKDGAMQVADITASAEHLAAWQENVIALIDKAENAFSLYMMVNKPYALTFLEFASPHLSQEDFSKILSSAWVGAEYPNQDANLGKNKLVSMFKSADPKFLMTDEEREHLAYLDNPVTVYRGVTSYNAKNIRALSWILADLRA